MTHAATSRSHPAHAMLSAFGEFTGLANINAERGDRVWVTTGEEAIAVSEARPHERARAWTLAQCVGAARRSMSQPMNAARHEASNTPSFAESRSASSVKASAPTKSDIVKPMPPSQLTP